MGSAKMLTSEIMNGINLVGWYMQNFLHAEECFGINFIERQDDKLGEDDRLRMIF